MSRNALIAQIQVVINIALMVAAASFAAAFFNGEWIAGLSPGFSLFFISVLLAGAASKKNGGEK